MRKLSIAAVLVSLAACGPALANADLAAAKQCMQCHKQKEDFAGPSFHKIALKRKNESGAMAKMVATIQQGSAGSGGPHWGTAKMPDASERPTVSRAEAQKLAKWILQQ